MDFEEQLNFLSELLGDPNTSTDDMFPLARRKKAINRGEIQFAIDSKSIKEYATGTVASDEITLPSNWVDTFILVVDNKPISFRREMSLANWERHYQGSVDEPISYLWEFSGVKKIKFMTTSGLNGKTYQLWYYKKPTTELSDNTDESIMLDEFREASVYWAAHRLLQQIGKSSLSDRMFQQYTLLVQKAILQTGRDLVEHLPAVPDLGDYGYSYTDRQGQWNNW